MSINPYAPSTLEPDASAFDTQGREESIRRAHINHEASIKSVGILYYLGGFLTVIAAVFLFINVGNMPRVESLAIGGIYLVCGLLGIVAGYGIRTLAPWGKIMSAIFAVLGLIAFPIGTIINGYVLYLLFSKKGQMVFSPEYKTIIEATPHVKYKTSLLVKILLILLVLLIVGGIVAGLTLS